MMRTMKKLKYFILFVLMVTGLASCSDWLEVAPQDKQISDTYWTSQEDVEAMLGSGYYYLRDMVTDYLIPLGELRGGSVFSIKTNKLQNFQVKPTDEDLCNWGPFYQVINIANVVLANAQKARDMDD